LSPHVEAPPKHALFSQPCPTPTRGFFNFMRSYCFPPSISMVYTFFLSPHMRRPEIILPPKRVKTLGPLHPPTPSGLYSPSLGNSFTWIFLPAIKRGIYPRFCFLGEYLLPSSPNPAPGVKGYSGEPPGMVFISNAPPLIRIAERSPLICSNKFKAFFFSGYLGDLWCLRLSKCSYVLSVLVFSDHFLFFCALFE